MNLGFQSKLSATEIGEKSGRSVWRLNESLVFRLNSVICIEAPKGFETDLASVPRLPLIYDAWGDRAHREAVIHDYMYRKDAHKWIWDKDYPVAHEGTISKEDADWYFRQAMILNGVSWFVYHPMYLAVRTAGASSFHKMSVTDHFPLDKED
jgi:hypothetical protein